MVRVRYAVSLHRSYKLQSCCERWLSSAVWKKAEPKQPKMNWFVLAAEDGRRSIEQLACRVRCKCLLPSQGLKEGQSLSGWREGAVKGTSASWRQLCSVVVWCPGHICFTGGEPAAVLSCCLAAVWWLLNAIREKGYSCV